MIHVLAILTAQPGKRAEVLRVFQANVPNVLAEEGCIEYAATVDAADGGPAQTPLGPDTFVVVEKWSSAATLAAHAASAHMKAYAAAVGPMMAGRVLHILSPVP